MKYKLSSAVIDKIVGITFKPDVPVSPEQERLNKIAVECDKLGCQVGNVRALVGLIIGAEVPKAVKQDEATPFKVVYEEYNGWHVMPLYVHGDYVSGLVLINSGDTKYYDSESRRRHWRPCKMNEAQVREALQQVSLTENQFENLATTVHAKTGYRTLFTMLRNGELEEVEDAAVEDGGPAL